MESIIIPFIPNNLGRIVFAAHVMTGNRKSLDKIRFKLDYGSDFTTISCDDLKMLGYTDDFLQNCPFHKDDASAAFGKNKLKFQYITDVSIKFGNRELQGCRIFYALRTDLRSLFGTDILKYFNSEINYDIGEICLRKRSESPALSRDEKQIQIYSLE